MDEYIGKICPFCKTEIKEGEGVIICPECGMPFIQSNPVIHSEAFARSLVLTT